MLDVAWPELIVIGVVALVAIGPKDLPRVMFGLGKWVGKVRRYGDAFRQSMEELSFEAEAAERAARQAKAAREKAAREQDSAKPEPSAPVDVTSDSASPNDQGSDGHLAKSNAPDALRDDKAADHV